MGPKKKRYREKTPKNTEKMIPNVNNINEL